MVTIDCYNRLSMQNQRGADAEQSSFKQLTFKQVVQYKTSSISNLFYAKHVNVSYLCRWGYPPVSVRLTLVCLPVKDTAALILP